MKSRVMAFIAALIAAGVLVGSGSASAPTSASCIAQFFSSHAGSGAEGVTVGGFISPTARELGKDFGQAIAGGRNLPRGRLRPLAVSGHGL